jgi:nitrite reductase/ring-hydroxylating ferredoxin subunit
LTETRILCRLEDIPDGEARGFPPPPGCFTGLVAVRRGAVVHVYVNSCPHIGIPLESLPDRFLDGARRHLVCTAHGARFRIEDGFCVSGPCAGDALEGVEARVEEDGRVTVVVPEGI